jgi:hypothetical protein
LRLPTHGGLYAWEFEKDGRELKVHVEGQLVFNGTFQMLTAALAGFGLAYVPEDVAQPHLAKGRLRRVFDDWCPLYFGYHLYYPSRRQACCGTKRMKTRIASPEMFPEAAMLPHLICSRPIFIGGANDEADQHGGA